jgi:predicted nucleic acid-binding protein
MSGTDAFFDTNVLLYLLSGDASKADRAEALVAAGGIISVQVLNEFASVASRKLGMYVPTNFRGYLPRTCSEAMAAAWA